MTKKVIKDINPQIKEKSERDLVFSFDENVLNHSFLGLFNSDEVYSLRQLLVNSIPKEYRKYILMTEGMFTNILTTFTIPELK
jgi:hypothetical protein